MSLREILDAMEKTLGAPSDGGFRQAGGMLGDAKASIREQMQAKTAPGVAEIIKKLRADHDLTNDEIDLVRTWVIGDAEGYLQAENDFQSWLDEFGRLRGELAAFVDRDLEVDDMIQLQGLIEDAVRVSFDIANYLEKKQRVENFEQTTRDPGRINKPVLAALLSRKLESGQA